MIGPSMIKRARSSIGITQKKLAMESGVSQSLIAKIESGKLDPTYSRMNRIDTTLKRLSISSEMKASQIMTKRIFSAQKEANVLKIIKIMAKNSISQIPVIDNNVVIGLLTESAILEHSTRTDFHSLEANDIMSEAPPTINKNTPVSIIRELLRHSPIVLVSSKGEISGVITKADLLKNQI